MHNDLLDIVDANDVVIAQYPRAEVHLKGQRHRAVHILVFNDKDELFLQKRSLKKDLNKGLWDSSAAGHVDSGETYDDCAPRELAEELGVSSDLKSLFKLDASPALGMEFIQVYRCTHNGPFDLAPDEIDEGYWSAISSIDDRVSDNDPSLTETFKIIWRRFRITSR